MKPVLQKREDRQIMRWAVLRCFVLHNIARKDSSIAVLVLVSFHAQSSVLILYYLSIYRLFFALLE